VNGASVEKEVKKLQTIKARWCAPHSYMRPSFLEQPRGEGRGIVSAVEWLQSSALDWGAVNIRDEGYTEEMAHLHAVAEQAVACFEEFRTVFSTAPLPILQALSLDEGYYDGFGRIPARIHKAVFHATWHAHTSSLYEIGAPPDVNGLKGAGVYIGRPLRDRHLAAIGALACCFRSINELCGILDDWRGLFRNRRGRRAPLHFDGNYGEPEWDDVLMAVRAERANLLHETNKRRDAFEWIARGEAWLAHGDLIERTHERIESAVQRAGKKAREQATEQRRQAAKSSQGHRKRAKEQRKSEIDAAWQLLPPSQQAPGGVAIVAKKVGASKRTVKRFLNELGYLAK
jgi:hypothetical protein